MRTYVLYMYLQEGNTEMFSFSAPSDPPVYIGKFKLASLSVHPHMLLFPLYR